MEALEAVGLAGNILTFIDFAYKLVTIGHSIHGSSSGATKSNEELAALSLHLDQAVTGLRSGKAANLLSDEEKALNEVCAQCLELSGDLQGLLQDLRARNPRSKRDSLRAAFRDWKNKDKKSELEKRLDQCRGQVNLQVTSLMR